MSISPQTDTEIPESFIEQVKAALENLYDFPALQLSPLAQVYERQGKESNSVGAHRLRGKLIEAIETLNPRQDVAAYSGAARIYNLVYLHYVGGMTLQEAAVEVGVSLRQAYRDLRRGQERVSAVLWYGQEREELSEAITEPAQLSSIETEITRLEGSMTTIPLQKMLENALRAVQKLADQRHIAIDARMPEGSALITTNPAIAQQVLTHVLSQVIQQIAPSHMRVYLEDHRDRLHIILSYPAASSTSLRIEPAIDQMMRQIRWKMQCLTPGNELHLIIRSAQAGALLLIIDDNQGLVDLLDHYLTDHSYRVISGANGEDGLRLVQQLAPDAIILDLMMPGMDGWELLQRLRTRGDTREIPVIICSVINDPELAYSLGASKFVPKPVTREMILDALRELSI